MLNKRQILQLRWIERLLTEVPLNPAINSIVRDMLDEELCEPFYRNKYENEPEEMYCV